MKDDKLDRIVILSKLCAICDLQAKLQEDKNKLEAKLEQIKKDEREDNNTQA